MTADKKRIQLAMARACMGIDDIAQAAQMPKLTARNVLQGRSVKPVTLGKVARALGVDVTELLPESNGNKSRG